jgi:hypothetical protein
MFMTFTPSAYIKEGLVVVIIWDLLSLFKMASGTPSMMKLSNRSPFIAFLTLSAVKPPMILGIQLIYCTIKELLNNSSPRLLLLWIQKFLLKLPKPIKMHLLLSKPKTK